MHDHSQNSTINHSSLKQACLTGHAQMDGVSQCWSRTAVASARRRNFSAGVWQLRLQLSSAFVIQLIIVHAQCVLLFMVCLFYGQKGSLMKHVSGGFCRTTLTLSPECRRNRHAACLVRSLRLSAGFSCEIFRLGPDTLLRLIPKIFSALGTKTVTAR